MRAGRRGPTWAELAQLAVVIASAWGASLVPAPGALDPSLRPWPTPIVVALLGLFIVAAQRRRPMFDSRRRGAPALVLSLALALLGIVIYFYLVEAWTCRYYAEVRVTGSELTPYAADYLQQDPALSCEELLKRFTGRSDEIWKPASSLPRELILNVTHLCAVAAAAVFALLSVRLLAQGRGAGGAPNEAGGAPSEPGGEPPSLPDPGRPSPGAGERVLPLALALSRIVLSHETILRHAQTALSSPELVEIPSPAHARALWAAVLRRAEIEARVPRLVALVLDENPDAEELDAALRTWREEGPEHGRSAASGPPRLATGARLGDGGRGALLRWGLFALGLLALAWLLAR